jgi:hypothetical protein
MSGCLSTETLLALQNKYGLDRFPNRLHGYTQGMRRYRLPMSGIQDKYVKPWNTRTAVRPWCFVDNQEELFEKPWLAERQDAKYMPSSGMFVREDARESFGCECAGDNSGIDPKYIGCRPYVPGSTRKQCVVECTGNACEHACPGAKRVSPHSQFYMRECSHAETDEKNKGKSTDSCSKDDDCATGYLCCKGDGWYGPSRHKCGNGTCLQKCVNPRDDRNDHGMCCGKEGTCTDEPKGGLDKPKPQPKSQTKPKPQAKPHAESKHPSVPLTPAAAQTCHPYAGTCPDGWEYDGNNRCSAPSDGFNRGTCDDSSHFGGYSTSEKKSWSGECKTTWDNCKTLSSGGQFAPKSAPKPAPKSATPKATPKPAPKPAPMQGNQNDGNTAPTPKTLTVAAVIKSGGPPLDGLSVKMASLMGVSSSDVKVVNTLPVPHGSVQKALVLETKADVSVDSLRKTISVALGLPSSKVILKEI